MLKAAMGKDYDKKTISTAISQNSDNMLAKKLRGHVEQNHGLSGFHIFESGEESLDARLFLINAAQETLDLQYYAISEGISSQLLIEAVIQSAQRGVRTRLMIDDISTGDIYRHLLALDSIENIEIRIFNPASVHNQSFPVRLVSAIIHHSRITRRMHNKALIADNQLAIVGGRNLGDEYFDAHEETAFKDIDILTAGPATADISKTFDEFWNGPHTYSIYELHKKRASLELVYNLRKNLKRNWNSFFKGTSGNASNENPHPQNLGNMAENLIWAKAEVIADTGGKVRDPDSFSLPLGRLREIAEQAKREFIIISSYFVPGEDGARWLRRLCKNNVNISVLTNSLASTDVVAVHTGYRKYRKRLLKGGVHIFELKPKNPGKKTRQRLLGRRSPSHASLHAKAYVIDGEYAVIGSFNFDPRSAFLNTEIGLFVQSTQLAAQLKHMFDETKQPETSYAVALDDEGDIFWNANENGTPVQYRREPKASAWRILQLSLISLFPVEGQL